MRILMIALHYHGYAEKIADELRLLGHSVRLHDIQPRDLVMKTLRVTSPGIWQKRLDTHHEAILAAERDTPHDMLLFIQCHQFSQANMHSYIAAFPDARFILYNWDSLSNHDYRPHLKAFDAVLTFDPDDARTYGLHYLPLFCSRDFQGLAKRDQQNKNIYFVGNVVSMARYDAFCSFQSYCQAHSIRLQSYLACTILVATRILRHGKIPFGIFFGPISKPKFMNMVESSVAAFDFANHAQSGYTMRIFENLCAGKKIITSNTRIRYENFYSPDRIHIFENLDFSGIKLFLDVPLESPDADFPDFQIQSFARHLIEARGHALPPLASVPRADP